MWQACVLQNLLSESGRRRSTANAEDKPSDEALDSQFGADVAAAVETWILQRMRDYHQAFAGDAILMAGLLEVLIAAELCKGKHAAVHQVCPPPPPPPLASCYQAALGHDILMKGRLQVLKASKLCQEEDAAVHQVDHNPCAQLLTLIRPPPPPPLPSPPSIHPSISL